MRRKQDRDVRVLDNYMVRLVRRSGPTFLFSAHETREKVDCDVLVRRKVRMGRAAQQIVNFSLRVELGSQACGGDEPVVIGRVLSLLHYY